MHSITIAFGEGQMLCWRLLFSKPENAQAAWALIMAPPVALPPYKPVTGSSGDVPMSMEQHRTTHVSVVDLPVSITDDFGQTVLVSRKEIKGAMLEDMDHSQLGDIEMRLHGARTQAKAQSRAQADPGLRAGAMAQPFNGGFARN